MQLENQWLIYFFEENRFMDQKGILVAVGPNY